MAVDMFMQVGALKGESQDKVHPGKVDVLAWSWGMSSSGTTHVSGGAGAGKVAVQDLSFTKYVDRASTGLMLACCAGTHFSDALLIVRKSGERPLEYLKVTMKDVLVSGVSTGGSGGEDRLTENVTLNFGEFKVEYTPQDPAGTTLPAMTMGWNIVTNTKA